MKEFIIWGKPEGSTDEDLLVSEQAGIKSMIHALQVIELLKTKHGCTDCRVQVLDLSEPFDWDARSIINA